MNEDNSAKIEHKLEKKNKNDPLFTIMMNSEISD